MTGVFHKERADKDQLDTINLLANAIARLFVDDGADPNLCRHVLLKMVISAYKWNTDHGVTMEEMSKVMWEEYAHLVRQSFQEHAPDILGGMLNAALADANRDRGYNKNQITK